MFSLLHSIPVRSHHKGLADWITTKPLTNPWGHLKDTAKAWKDNPLDAPAVAGGLGPGVLPSVVNKYAKATFDPMGSPYSYKRPGTEMQTKQEQGQGQTAQQQDATQAKRQSAIDAEAAKRRQTILRGQRPTTYAGRSLL